MLGQQSLGLFADHRHLIERFLWLAINTIQLAEEMNSQVGDVFASFIERWNIDGQFRKTVVEIGPETPCGYQARHILVRCGYQQHPGKAGLVFAQAHETTIIKKTQQLNLGFRVRITYFIKEHHAAAGLFDNALAIGMGAGKGTTLVAKQFRICQLPAIGGNIGFRYRQFAADASSTPIHLVEPIVDIVKEKLFATAGISSNQQCRQAQCGFPQVGLLPHQDATKQWRRNRFDRRNDVLRLIRVADDVAESIRRDFRVTVGDVSLQALHL